MEEAADHDDGTFYNFNNCYDTALVTLSSIELEMSTSSTSSASSTNGPEGKGAARQTKGAQGGTRPNSSIQHQVMPFDHEL